MQSKQSEKSRREIQIFHLQDCHPGAAIAWGYVPFPISMVCDAFSRSYFRWKAVFLCWTLFPVNAGLVTKVGLKECTGEFILRTLAWGMEVARFCEALFEQLGPTRKLRNSEPAPRSPHNPYIFSRWLSTRFSFLSTIHSFLCFCLLGLYPSLLVLSPSMPWPMPHFTWKLLAIFSLRTSGMPTNQTNSPCRTKKQSIFLNWDETLNNFTAKAGTA